MSKLIDLMVSNPFCNNKDTLAFMENIDKTFSHFPDNIKNVIEEDLVKVFEKGLLLGLRHFNGDK